jgi:hypothetical protein
MNASEFFSQPKFKQAKGFTREWWQRRAFIVLGQGTDETDEKAIDVALTVGSNAYDGRQQGFATSIWQEYSDLMGVPNPFAQPNCTPLAVGW